jgi:flagellar assembly protein FliH
VLGEIAERSRAAGRAQGFATGWAEGRHRARLEAERLEEERRAAHEGERGADRARLRHQLDALAVAAARVDTDLAAHRAELATAAVELALDIAEAVIGRELAVARDPGADALRRALADVPGTMAVTVRLHPADLAGLDHDVVAGRPLTLVGDPGLERGDARVDSETTSVDATVATALARVREVLGR